MALTKVSTDGVKDDAITKTKIPANQIEASELADNAVDTNAIANNAVTAGKLASGVQTTINNNADNRVITGSGTANTLNGESNVVIDSSGRVGIGTTSPSRNMELVNSSSSVQFSIVSANNQNVFLNLGDTDDDNIGGINYDNTNNRLRFRSNAADRAQLKSNGDFAIDDGNLVIGTSGHGIDFSATSDVSGMTSELLSDYEEGTYTPADASGQSISFSNAEGLYTRVGNLVHVQGSVTFPSTGGQYGFSISLPFTATSNGRNAGGGSIRYTTKSTVFTLHVNANAASFAGYTFGGTGMRNADLSTDRLDFQLTYRIA
jgi:hypothetical protein